MSSHIFLQSMKRLHLSHRQKNSFVSKTISHQQKLLKNCKKKATLSTSFKTQGKHPHLIFSVQLSSSHTTYLLSPCVILSLVFHLLFFILQESWKQLHCKEPLWLRAHLSKGTRTLQHFRK